MAKKAQKNFKETVVEKALELAVVQGWDKTTLADIAAEAHVSLAGLHEQFEDKTDILVALGRMVDQKVLKHVGGPNPELSARDALFDILMERFEVLNEYRAGVLAVLKSFAFDPKQVVIGMPHLCRSMTWMLEAAGLETGGFMGAARVAGLTGIYIKVLRTWKTDESEDLAKTMAALDKDLERAERAANFLGL